MPLRSACGGCRSHRRAQRYAISRDFPRCRRCILCASRLQAAAVPPPSRCRSAAVPPPLSRRPFSVPWNRTRIGEESDKNRTSSGQVVVSGRGGGGGIAAIFRLPAPPPSGRRPRLWGRGRPPVREKRGPGGGKSRFVQGYDKMILLPLRGNAYLCPGQMNVSSD